MFLKCTLVELAALFRVMYGGVWIVRKDALDFERVELLDQVEGITRH